MFSEDSLLLRDPQALLEWGVTKGAGGLVEQLLTLEGMSSGTVDKFGNSLLITAAWNGDDTLVRALLKSGAMVVG